MPREPVHRRFTRADRIIRQADFDRIHASRFFGADEVLVVKAARNNRGGNRLGLAVSRRVGNAVVRNRWKRLIREAFRQLNPQLPTGWDLVVRPRRGAVPRSGPVARSLERLVQRIDRFARREQRREERGDRAAGGAGHA